MEALGGSVTHLIWQLGLDSSLGLSPQTCYVASIHVKNQAC